MKEIYETIRNFKKQTIFVSDRIFRRNVCHGSGAWREPSSGTVFQLFTDRVDNHHWNDHDCDGTWQYLWWKKCGQVTKSGQIVWKDHDRSNLDCTDSGCRKIHCTWNLCTAHFYGEQ